MTARQYETAFWLLIASQDETWLDHCAALLDASWDGFSARS